MSKRMAICLLASNEFFSINDSSMSKPQVSSSRLRFARPNHSEFIGSFTSTRRGGYSVVSITEQVSLALMPQLASLWRISFFIDRPHRPQVILKLKVVAIVLMFPRPVTHCRSSLFRYSNRNEATTFFQQV
jgi:hypothetical protein